MAFRTAGPTSSCSSRAGIHVVTLGPPWNFAPLEQKVLLYNTAALDPYRIEFRILPPASIPISPGSPP